MAFYFQLFNATNDYVPYQNDQVEVIITQNDDASGIFSFASTDHVILKEGIPHGFT